MELFNLKIENKFQDMADEYAKSILMLLQMEKTLIEERISSNNASGLDFESKGHGLILLEIEKQMSRFDSPKKRLIAFFEDCAEDKNFGSQFTEINKPNLNDFIKYNKTLYNPEHKIEPLQPDGKSSVIETKEPLPPSPEEEFLKRVVSSVEETFPTSEQLSKLFPEEKNPDEQMQKMLNLWAKLHAHLNTRITPRAFAEYQIEIAKQSCPGDE